MTIADSRVVGWQWEHFVNNGFGDGYWIDQSGHEYPEILDQSDLKNPNKYRNMTALVPLSLLAEAESERSNLWGKHRELSGSMEVASAIIETLKIEKAALQSRLDAVVGLMGAAVCPMAAQGCDGTQYPVGDPDGGFHGEQCQWCHERNELRAALGGESRGNEEELK